MNEDKIRRYAFPPSDDSIVVVCGLPGVYEKPCGPRSDEEIRVGSALSILGYTKDMVIKL